MSTTLLHWHRVVGGRPVAINQGSLQVDGRHVGNVTQEPSGEYKVVLRDCMSFDAVDLPTVASRTVGHLTDELMQV